MRVGDEMDLRFISRNAGREVKAGTQGWLTRGTVVTDWLDASNDPAKYWKP